MAYDDRFYSNLNRSEEGYQRYRDKMAEDSANTTRQLGDIYGAIPGEVVGNAMKGADWRQNRDIRESEEQRAQETQGFRRDEFGREGERFGREKSKWGSEDFRRNMEDEQLRAENEFLNQAASAEEGRGFAPGMTRRQIGIAQKLKSGGLANTLTEENINAARAQAAFNRTQQLTAEEQRKMSRAQLEIDALVSEPPSPARDLKIKDIAARHKLDPNLINAAATSGVRKFLADQTAAAQGAEVATNLNETTAAVRRDAIKIKDYLAKISKMHQTGSSGYDLATPGFNDFTDIPQQLAAEYLPGYKTVEQEGLLDETIEDLKSMGEFGLAKSLSNKTLSISDAIQQASIKALGRKEKELQDLIANNPTMQNDRIVQETVRAMGVMKQKLQGGYQPVQLLNTAPKTPMGQPQAQPTAPGAPTWVGGAPGAPQATPLGTMPANDPFNLEKQGTPVTNPMNNNPRR